MDTPPEVPSLLRVPEFSAALRIKDRTTRQWISSRRIASVRVGRRAVRIPATEVRRLFEAGFVPARAERSL